MDHSAAGDTTSTYTYPAANAPHAHGVSGVSVTGPSGTSNRSYSYDAAGNTSARTLGGVPETLTWNSEGKLTSHVRSGQTTSFVYDADGDRLLRREAGAVTLYLDNSELRLDVSTRALSSTRYYVFNGQTVAVRTGAGGLKLLVDDHQGTASLAVDAVSGQVSRRRNTPFGESRQQAGTWPSQRGFVGGTTDTTTGLVHLGAREYDPGIGRFISVDPVLDQADPQQMQGYSYASNAPITRSDPTGLYAVWDPSTGGYTCVGGCGSDYDTKDTKRTCGGANYCNTADKGRGRSGGGSGGGANASYGGQTASTSSHAAADAAAARLAALVKARAAREAQKQRLIKAAKALIKIAADELGITAGLDCLTTGNIGACAETAVNVISAFAGGVAGKLMAKYGVPWKWAKGSRLVKTLWKIGGEAVDAMKGWMKAGQELKSAAKSCSFGGTTTVLMADGSKRQIQDVRIGDRVIATDPETGERAAKKVLQVFVHDDEVVDLAIDGRVVTTTEDHPFWSVTDGRFERADELASGERVLTADGRQPVVSGLRLATTRRAPAYNLSVEGIHTYHVGQAALLVHNECEFSDAVEQGLDHMEDEVGRGKMDHIIEGSNPCTAAGRCEVGRYLSGFEGRTPDYRDTGTGAGIIVDRSGSRPVVIVRKSYSIHGYHASERYLARKQEVGDWE